LRAQHDQEEEIMVKRIKVKDGPLEGKSFDVPDDAEVLGERPGLPKGRYVVKGDTASWEPARKPAKTSTTRKAPAKRKHATGKATAAAPTAPATTSAPEVTVAGN
jgi:hypothetical protein